MDALVYLNMDTLVYLDMDTLVYLNMDKLVYTTIKPGYTMFTCTSSIPGNMRI